MTSIVARLRLVAESDVVASLDDLIEACDLGQMIEGCDRTSGVLQDCAFTIANLDTLLTIAERLSWLRDPYHDEYDYCPYCHEDISSNYSGEMKPKPASVHDPKCPWLLARRACGMEDEG